MSDDQEYGQSKRNRSISIDAPKLDYLPPQPTSYRPPIGLIGAGGITEYHLRAYRAMGLDIVAICDVDIERAENRRDEFYAQAEVYADFQQLLARDDIGVVDIATHPEHRVAIIEAAIRAGKHVLSQKPFVIDIDAGERLVDLADRTGVQLAVNQNGRWAPHFSYLQQAIRNGLVGELASVDFVQQWDHTWTAETPFEEIHHLILYDFAVHWFDMTCAFFHGRRPQRVYASVQRTSFQTIKPPFLAHVVIDFESAQARIAFNAHVACGQEDRTIIAASKGTLRATGPSLNEQSVQLWTDAGHATPKLEGCWFDNGFRGTMGELLCAIEQDREPANNGRDNLRSLELCFAAIASADTRQPQVPGSIRRLPKYK